MSNPTTAPEVALHVLDAIRQSHPELIADNMPADWGMNKLRSALAPSTVRMGCADEGFQEREFTLIGKTGSGKSDYVCTCGWMQTSARAGGQELLDHATWHDEAAKRAFAELVLQQPDGQPS